MAYADRPLPFNQKKRLIVVQAGAVLAAALLLFTRPAWNDQFLSHDFVELTGAGLVLLCILGRLWSTLYIGGRKNDELVTTGPFSVTRNPLYVSSTIGAVGIGLMFGSLIVALLLGIATYQIFRVTAAREAAFLAGRFGPAYEAYAKATPIFWPDPRRYHDTAAVSFSPLALKRTFLDGLYFLAIFPVIELVEQLQASGHLPVLMSIY
jgi:protein-S-isoprenylcysteine O-methyltransferase Ste14